MPIDPEELMRIIGAQEQTGQDTQTLEQLLCNQILNPVKLQRSRIKIDDNLPEGVVFELREGTVINEAGHPEELQELVINPNTFADGSPMNLYGITTCPQCGSHIHEDNMVVCQCCNKFCCTVKGCANYSWFLKKWFSSRKCKFLGFFRIRFG